jgi:LuxR family quorum-sensing system transcriptional regulator CciR
MAAKQQQARLNSGISLADAFIRAARSLGSRDELPRLMEEVTAELGFRYYALIHHADLRGSPPGLIDIRDYPKASVKRIVDEGKYGRVRQGGVISAVAVGHRQAALAVMCRG